MEVHVAHADIISIPADAIVNPANSQGIMGSGVAGAIRRVGGNEIQAEAMSHAPIAVGAACITTAGNLPAKAVIHAPTMANPGDRIGAENVRRATRAVLIAAMAGQYKVLAIPGMGQSGGVPKKEAARAIVQEIRAHKKAFPQTIYLVDSDEQMVEAFEAALNNAQQYLY
jgi:O-acetyl-ADP-ribose deacetylase (regulator of RNase III)